MLVSASPCPLVACAFNLVAVRSFWPTASPKSPEVIEEFAPPRLRVRRAASETVHLRPRKTSHQWLVARFLPRATASTIHAFYAPNQLAAMVILRGYVPPACTWPTANRRASGRSESADDDE